MDDSIIARLCSWLRLAPNNKVSGGKVLSSKIPKGSNRLKIVLRNAANAIGNLKDSTPLRDFFQRINFRKGRVSAVSATARKLAVIFWNMVVKGSAYLNPENYLFLDQKIKLGLVKRIQKQIDNFALTNDDQNLHLIDFLADKFSLVRSVKLPLQYNFVFILKL